MRHVALENVATGYDVLSYDEEGNEKYTEVKSSRARYVRFELTANELDAAETYSGAYWIYRVFNVEDNPEALEIENPAARIKEGQLVLQPVSFMVSIGEDFRQ